MRRGGRWVPFAAALVVGVISIAFFARGEAPDEATAPVTTSSTTTAINAAPTTTTTLVEQATAAVESTTTTTMRQSASGADLSGGVATVGVIGPATTLNPFIERSGLGDAVGAVTWASAFVLNGRTYELEPGVLAEIPSFANQGLVANGDGSVTVTLRLSPDARWQDGEPITGHDLAFTADLIAGDRRIDRELRDRYAMISEPSASDETYTFKVSQPSVDYLSLFEEILPRHQVEGTDLINDWDARVWLSAGPFIAGTLQDDGSVSLRRNPQYGRSADNGTELPYLDGLTITPYPTSAEVLVALTEKLLSVGDLAGDYGPAANRSDLSVSSAQGEEWEHVGFQFGTGRFVANPRSMVTSPGFRDLVAVVVGDDLLVSEIGGSALYPASSIVASSWPSAAASHRVPIDEPSLDLIATELERDFQEQPPTVVYATTVALDRSQMAGIALRELAARGVAVDVELQDPGLFFRDSVIEGSFEVAEWAWTISPGPLGAVRDLQSWFGTSPSRDGLDFYRWSANTQSESLVAEIAAVDSIMDLDQLAVSLRSIDSQLLDRVVVVPLWQSSAGAGFDPLRIGGYVHPRFGVPITWNADSWLVPGGCANVPEGAVCGGPIQPTDAG